MTGDNGAEARPARLRAELVTEDGTVVHVPGVPAPAPASGGRITVNVPYPVTAPGAVVTGVTVVNQDQGTALKCGIPARHVSPGDTLSVEFTAADSDVVIPVPVAPGYSFAARVTTGFDGGNHPLKGDLAQCARCAALVLPDSQETHDRHHALIDAVAGNLATLNEVIAEMTSRVSGDPGFTALVRDLLRNHSHEIGYQFQGDGGGS